MVINDVIYRNIKNLNIRRYEIRFSIYTDNFDFLKDIMEGLKIFHKDIEIYFKPNLFVGYINVFIEFDFYTNYKLNLIRKKLYKLQDKYLDRHKLTRL